MATDRAILYDQGGYEDYIGFIFKVVPFNPKYGDTVKVFLEGLASLFAGIPIYAPLGEKYHILMSPSK